MWWLVQGNVTLYTTQYGPAKVGHRDTTNATLRVVPLLEEASGLHGHTFCRGNWLHHVDVDFNQSFKSWYIIGFHRDFIYDQL